MILIFIFCSLLISPDQQDLSEIDWLIGRWASVDNQDDEQSYELWTEISDQQFQGVSYTTDGRDTSFFEHLEITLEEGQFYYIADVPQNPVPVSFRITEMSDTSLICENPGYDFPQKIVYRKRGEILVVEIFGDTKRRQFRFRKEEKP